MRIRVWHAFASNNSGSYVIVGNFPSVELAAEVAAELRAVAIAYSAWLDLPVEQDRGPDPLADFAARHGLPFDADAYDDWPHHSQAPHPAVWALGHQVFVYSDYTVTMPRLIGHAMYQRGGRVEAELDHTHHPIVALFEVYFPWERRAEIDVPARVQDLVDALSADDGALTTLRVADHAPAWRGTTADGERAGFGEGDIMIGAVFEDLCAGFTAVGAAVTAVGALMRVRVIEAVSGEIDPLAYLRPCSPPTRHALVDVVLEELGLAPTNVVKVVAATRGIGYRQAHELVQKLPVTIVEGVSMLRAQELAVRLRVGNAVVVLRGPSGTAD